MASCSRDSTVRLWSLISFITPLQINILADRSWEEIIGTTGTEHKQILIFSAYILQGTVFFTCWISSPDRAMESGVPPLLCGKVSREIKQEAEKLTTNLQVRKLRWFSECLSVSIVQLRYGLLLQWVTMGFFLFYFIFLIAVWNNGMGSGLRTRRPHFEFVNKSY